VTESLAGLIRWLDRVGEFAFGGIADRLQELAEGYGQLIENIRGITDPTPIEGPTSTAVSPAPAQGMIDRAEQSSYLFGPGGGSPSANAAQSMGGAVLTGDALSGLIGDAQSSAAASIGENLRGALGINITVSAAAGSSVDQVGATNGSRLVGDVSTNLPVAVGGGR